MMRGSDLKDWRTRNGYTQDMLRMALDLGSRQTIISWEKSDEPLARTVELALLALEFLPEKSVLIAGRRCTAAEHQHQRKRPSVLFPPANAPLTSA
jgi:DNA-binding XRE family transcriptional regulator